MEKKIVVRRWKAGSTEISYNWDDSGFIFTATASDQRLALVINGVISCPESIYDLVFEEILPVFSSYQQLSSLNGYYCDVSQKRLTLASDSSHGISILIKDLHTLYNFPK